jgi:DNA-binding NarL/FixJ family response regulator
VSEPIRVVIAVSNDVGRLGFEQILLRAPRYQVVACGRDASTVVDGPPADVAVVGLGQHLEPADLPAIVAACPRVLCFGRPEHRAAGLAAGVSGYLAAAGDASEVIALVALIAAGGTYQPVDGFPPDLLSPREREVLMCVASGCTDREIGDRLGISMRTAQSHLDRIREKTGRRRRAELTALAYELGLAGVS